MHNEDKNNQEKAHLNSNDGQSPSDNKEEGQFTDNSGAPREANSLNSQCHTNMRNKKHLDERGQERRDFLTSSLGIVGACGAAALAIPFIDQLRPSSSQKDTATIEVDISSLKQGEEMTVSWRGQPVVVRNRSQAEIEAARNTPLGSLEDKLARNANLPAKASADDAARSAGQSRENWLVFINVCTHLGCPTQRVANGWFCPCHGSRYDVAARVTKGPANKNMAIPPYKFLSDTIIQIG